MSRQVFDASFKRMAINLSYAWGSVEEVADELALIPAEKPNPSLSAFP